MNNQFRDKIEPQEPKEKQNEQEGGSLSGTKESSSTTVFKIFFVEGVITKEAATAVLPFLIFLCVLAMIYIANSHMAVKNIRKIGVLNKEVRELSWQYKSLKADLMFKSKLTEVAKKVDTLGIKELIEPPKKLIVESDEH